METAWVAKPNVIGGLDHVGTQGPCIQIYSQLLPGITNVTDRARYYSFYPWFIWSYDQRHPAEEYSHFVERYRRADCLFTLIAERHFRVSPDDGNVHGPAMVGRQKLTAAVSSLETGQELQLSTYTGLSESGSRYFANPLGGLGQYYAGVLTQLDILQKAKAPWIGYTFQYGEQIARGMSAAVPEAKFWEIVDRDRVTAQDLDNLHAFCPCQMKRSKLELDALLDVFFDRTNRYGEEGLQRRQSLALLLDLSSALQAAEAGDLDETAFRISTYTRHLPDGTPWAPAPPLISTLEAWQYYVRNDILSMAMQSAFAVALSATDGLSISEAPSIEAISHRIANGGPVQRALGKLKAGSFGQLCEQLRSSGPPMEDFSSEEHELRWAIDRFERPQSNDTEPTALAQIIRILAILAIRDRLDLPAYGPLAIDAADLEDSPINLSSVRSRCDKWQEMTLTEVVDDLLRWCLQTHLRVALRKLSHTGQATFRIKPTELGLERMGDTPAPAKTNSRVRQATMILQDIGAMARKGDTPGGTLGPTALGNQLRELANG